MSRRGLFNTNQRFSKTLSLQEPRGGWWAGGKNIERASFPLGGYGRQADAPCGVCGLIIKMLKCSNAPSNTI